MSSVTTQEAKNKLDLLINIYGVDSYYPIQIAEILYRSRTSGDIQPSKLETYQTSLLSGVNAVSLRLSGKFVTSLASYQHKVWTPTDISPAIFSVLNRANKRTGGAVERYIYLRYTERLQIVSNILNAFAKVPPEHFNLSSLFEKFVSHSQIRQSIGKVYEIAIISLCEIITENIVRPIVTVKVSASPANREIVREFSDLTRVLLGLDANNLSWEQPAHIYRVGVTNAADRGLDMWANFGPAVQVKHLTLNENLANEIIDQVESDHIVIVCRDAEADVIQTVIRQIGWGRRVRGIVREADLIEWYERCLRGKFKDRLAQPLLKRLIVGFKAEFPQTRALAEFLEERGYAAMVPPVKWKTETDEALIE